MKFYRRNLLILLVILMVSFIGCGKKEVKNPDAVPKFKVGDTIEINLDVLNKETSFDEKAKTWAEDNKDRSFKIKEVKKFSNGIKPNYILDSSEFNEWSEEYLKKSENKQSSDDSKEECINIFESTEIWNKYVAGDYTGKKVSFEGTVDSEGIPGGVDKDDAVLTVYLISHKTDDGYMTASIGTITDDKVKKGDKVTGWGLINSSEKSLGAPTIMVLDVNKK